MNSTMLRYALCAFLGASVAACGGGGGSSDLSSMSSSGATTQSASVPLVVSNASSDDWALVGVQILSIALVPQAAARCDGLHRALVSALPESRTARQHR